MPCREITSGADLDVIEIDAATYSKVEQVRELTESLRYGPARDAYKVVVIDEIHRLSRQAFDALLKIVEEPPPHLVFIFATTEIEVVPATILSRCQEFHFRRVRRGDARRPPAPTLRRRGDRRPPTARCACSRAPARAASATRWRCSTSSPPSAPVGSPRRTRCACSAGSTSSSSTTCCAPSSPATRRWSPRRSRRVEDEGWDPRRTHDQFLAYCRDALHAAVGTDPERLDLPAEDAEQLAALAKGAGYENLLRLLNQMLKSEELVRRSETPGLAVEIAWLRAAELPKLIRIEELLARPLAGPGSGAGAGPRGGAGARGARVRGGERRIAVACAPLRAAADRARAARRTVPPRRTGAESGATARGGAARTARASRLPGTQRWRHRGGRPSPRLSSDPKEALLELVSQRKQPLAARLRDCRALRFENGALEVVIARGDAWLREALDRPQNREILDGAVRQVWGGARSMAHRRGDGDGARCRARGRAAGADDRPSGGAIRARPLRRHHRDHRGESSSGGAMNLQKLMKQAQEMQNRLQGELETLEVEAAVGGGMVAVTMNGHKQLMKVKIDREVLDPDDPEMLQDLVVAAVNEASRKVDEAVQSKIGGMAGGLPGMFR